MTVKAKYKSGTEVVFDDIDSTLKESIRLAIIWLRRDAELSRVYIQTDMTHLYVRRSAKMGTPITYRPYDKSIYNHARLDLY